MRYGESPAKLSAGEPISRASWAERRDCRRAVEELALKMALYRNPPDCRLRRDDKPAACATFSSAVAPRPAWPSALKIRTEGAKCAEGPSISAFSIPVCPSDSAISRLSSAHTSSPHRMPALAYPPRRSAPGSSLPQSPSLLERICSDLKVFANLQIGGLTRAHRQAILLLCTSVKTHSYM